MSQGPEFFGKFVLLEKLATGGMAEVYLAKAMGAENVWKFVAIKRILPQFSQNAEFIDMFKEEAKIAINLAHGNIVPIYEFGEEKGQFFLVMEFVEGRNLRQIINRIQNTGQKLSIEHCTYIINEVARGLDAAHRCVDGTTGRPLNITHRDISPQNAMINFEGEVKVCDFGIAKAESKIENTQAGTLKGKFGYMSPEQAEGQEIDCRTDIFSLGIVLWELLAQERLFLSNNELNTLRKIRDCQIPSLRKIDPNIPTELERICNKALTKDRNLRYQSAAEFHRDLNRFMNRQFPDFSSQDFSTFIKQLYAKEREEHRQKMIAYGKIQAIPVDSNPNEATQYVSRDVFNKTITETKSLPGSTEQGEKGDFLKGLKIDENSKSRIERLDLNIRAEPGQLQRQALNQKAERGTNPGMRSGTSPGRIASQQNQAAPQIRTQTYSGAYSGVSSGSVTASSYGRSHSRGSSNFVSKFLTFTFLMAGATAVMALYFKGRPEELKTYVRTYPVLETMVPPSWLPKERMPSAEPTPVPKPRGPQSRLIVNSNPSGAEIYVNNELVGMTPTQVDVPRGEAYTLLIMKQNHTWYCERKTSTMPTDEVNPVLPPGDFGYVNLQVRPSEAIIYVNDCPMPYKAPVARLAVPAGQETKISVYNAIVKSYADERVQIKKDFVIPLTLFMKKLDDPNRAAAGK